MLIRFPRALRPGSRIGLVAPSSPVSGALAPRLELVKANLRAHGFEPVESRCLRAEQTPPWQARLEAWMEALEDDSLDAVFPPWGGELAIEVLARMDFERLRPARPKWILGYSDISTLLVPMLLELGWASAHGPNAMDLVPAQRDPLSAGVLSILSSTGPFTQRSSAHFQTAFVDWKARPGAPFHLDQPTRVRTLDGRPVQARGRLIGGCLDTLANLVGTRVGDVPRFVRTHRDEGVILFLENCELQPGQAARVFMQLRMAGWLEGVSALLLGRSRAPEASGQHHAAELRRMLGDLGLPVVFDADLGHVPPQWTLIEGAMASLEIADSQGAITQQR
jgi:muramoyltetrapeptide carboxypeptidase LdcA involved in peptidoglycan recycling